MDHLVIRLCMGYYNCGSLIYKGLYGILQLVIRVRVRFTTKL